jgi:adenylate cyclase, class 2
MFKLDYLRRKVQMSVINFEFKAVVANPDEVEQTLKKLNPIFKGEDHQIDTYFNVSTGRLKLREGTIENALIHYDRKNEAGAKQSDIILYEHSPSKALKEILIKTLGVKVIVDKSRRIYFIDNVKFHFDTVKGLGRFIEVEAIDRTGDIGIEKLKEQCLHYANLFDLQSHNYIDNSYSDMLVAPTTS